MHNKYKRDEKNLFESRFLSAKKYLLSFLFFWVIRKYIFHLIVEIFFIFYFFFISTQLVFNYEENISARAMDFRKKQNKNKFHKISFSIFWILT